MAGNRRRMTLTIAVVGGAVVVGLGLLVVALIGIAGRPADNRESPAAVATSTTTTTSTTALAAAMREWQSRAGDHFKESAKALDQVSEGTERDDEAAVRTGCQRLHDTNAVGLQADLPTPDPALTAELQRMIDDVNTAAHACLRFSDSRSQDDASTYQIYLTRAVDHLTTAKQILNGDLGKG
jgi:hypothetical protein